LVFFYLSSIFGFDVLSVFFFILSSFLIFFCFLVYWYLRYLVDFYIFILFLSFIFLCIVFFSLDFFIFFIFFEAVAFPIFLLIGVWGSRFKKIEASYKFFVYTVFGSIFIILCLFTISSVIGSSFIELFKGFFFFDNRFFYIFLFFFLGFSVKIPMFPFHIWLPEAHVEAPTPGSVILAGLLLKLGTFGFFRFIIGFFVDFTIEFLFFILSAGLYSFLLSGIIALSQFDIKKLIAYSSISHMNFSVLGFFSFSLIGLSGSFFMMFGHAITSSSLFLSVGVAYDRYKTRLLMYYGGLATVMPLYSVSVFFSILSNFAFPGTINFVGEFLISFGIVVMSNVLIIFVSLGMVITLIYSMFFYNRFFFGEISFFIRFFSDCTRLEFFILYIFLFFIIFLGLFPSYLFSFSVFFLKKCIFLYF
jgi:proton-translocating NADH-quinone oxidoreductase chain M